MKNLIPQIEAFAGGTLVNIGKGLFIVALAYPIVWLLLVWRNS